MKVLFRNIQTLAVPEDLGKNKTCIGARGHDNSSIFFLPFVPRIAIFLAHLLGRSVCAEKLVTQLVKENIAKFCKSRGGIQRKMMRSSYDPEYKKRSLSKDAVKNQFLCKQTQRSSRVASVFIYK